MDDVEDNSELRRGIPVAHTIYGVPQTINTANYVYFLAMKELLALKPEDRKGKGKEVDLTGLVTGKRSSHT
jgi:geranylgeranyl diphosphate synthase type 3